MFSRLFGVSNLLVLSVPLAHIGRHLPESWKDIKGQGSPIIRFVMVSSDSAPPCSQSTFARIVPYWVLAACSMKQTEQDPDASEGASMI